MVTFDFSLEMVLVLLVLRSQSDCLIDLLDSQTLAEEGSAVLLLGLLVHLSSQVIEALSLVVLVHDLLAKHINLALVILVL